MSTYTEDQRKVTTHRLIEMKSRGEKIAMLTRSEERRVGKECGS